MNTNIQAIINVWNSKYQKADLRCLAYILATADYETDRQFIPTADKTHGKGMPYGEMIKLNGKPYSKPYQLYYRRGIIPLCWYENYERIGILVKRDLIHHPDLLLNTSLSIEILVDGMMNGWFTGKKLTEFFNQGKYQWIGARSVVKTSEKSYFIAALAAEYYISLTNYFQARKPVGIIHAPLAI